MKVFEWTAQVTKKRGTTFDLPIAQGSIVLSPNNQASSMQIMIRPKDYESTGGVSIEDQLSIYYRTDDSQPKKNYLLQNFTLRNIQKTYSLDRLYYEISGVDYTHFFLSYLGTKKNTNKTWVSTVQVYLTELNARNSTAGLPTITLSSTNPSVKSTGGAFPTIEYFAYQKPFNEILNELTTSKYTGDGKYDWKIGNDFKLYFYKSTTYPVRNLSNIIIKDYVKNDGVDQIINQCIIYAGNDLNDSPIYTQSVNLSSIAKYGLHDKLEVKKSFREEIYDLHKNDAPPLDNTQFRNLVIDRAKEYADNIVNQGWAEAIQRFDITTYGLVIEPYDKLTLPSLIGATKTMYVKTVTHTLTKTTGWTTKIVATELGGLIRG